MFDNKEVQPWFGIEAHNLSEASRAAFEDTKKRLDGELPKGIYLSREEFAVLIGKSVKTLMNDEAPNGKKQYPIPIRHIRGVNYSREDVLDWLSIKELESRARRIHRCS